MAATETGQIPVKPEKSPAKKVEKSAPGGLLALPHFLHQAWHELKKVHHPTRQETIQATMVVLAMVVTVAVFLGSVDFALGWVMHWATQEAL